MPIKLKGVLIKHGISHPALAAEIKQAKDVPLSRTALNQILNHSYFPRSIAPESIRQQIEDALAERGVPAAELAGCWEPEGDDRYRGVYAIGSHVGKAGPTKRDSLKAVPTKPDFEPLEIQMLSPQAKRHFKLFRDPFVADINSAEDVFMSESQQYALEAMLQTAKLRSMTALIGESGSGKSTLRKLMQNQILANDEKIRLVFPRTVDKSKLTTVSIETAIVRDLAPDETLPQRNEDRSRLVTSILNRMAAKGISCALEIEEAHDLTVQELKYLKRFNEAEGVNGFGSGLAIILIAQPELRIKLDAHRYPSMREFINRCEVATLDPLHQHVGAYIKHKFARIGVDVSSVMTDDTFEAIRNRWTKIDPATRQVKTELYPLTVNNTVTNALNKAASLGLPLVTGDLIKEL